MSIPLKLGYNMTNSFNFIKMEGLGNDFIVIHTASAKSLQSIVKQCVKLCDRRRGIGADGIIFIQPSKKADFKMRIFNSDGSEAEMCGNGIRCCSLYVKSMKMSKKQSLTFETNAGINSTEFLKNNKIRVNMGLPILESSKIPTIKKSCRVIMHDLQVDCKKFKITAVSMGNPHAVIFSDELTDDLVSFWGPKIEKHPFFPKKTNVEFIKVLSEKEIQMRVWERGAGETLACGTGACASVVAGIIDNILATKVKVRLPGGDLLVEWNGKESSPVFMTGPAKMVFEGRVEI
jgi:diaminopimelate epimerase